MKNIETEGELITREQLARLMNVSKQHIRRMEKEGLPVINIGKKTKRYNYDAVLQFIAEKNDLAKDIN